MNRLAAEHPDDERYATAEGQREVLTDLADMQEGPTPLRPCPPCTVCEAEIAGSRLWKDGKVYHVACWVNS